MFEWRNICIQTDSVLRTYAESMRAVTATINFQVCTITDNDISTNGISLDKKIK